MRNFILIIITFLVHSSVNAQPKIGSIAPEISIPDTTGQTRSLSSLQGKVVLVDFWASWCAPCRKSNRSIGSIYNKYHQKGFEILGISLDTDIKAWQKAIRADRINWLQVQEPGGWDAPTALAWGIEQLPAAWLLDKQGRVISIDPTHEELEKYLQQALK